MAGECTKGCIFLFTDYLGCGVCDLSPKVYGVCVTGYRKFMKWEGNIHKSAQSVSIRALASSRYLAADVVPVHKVLDKCFKRS